MLLVHLAFTIVAVIIIVFPNSSCKTIKFVFIPFVDKHKTFILTLVKPTF